MAELKQSERLERYWDTVELGKEKVESPRRRYRDRRSGGSRRRSSRTEYRRDLSDEHTFQALADHTESKKSGSEFRSAKLQRFGYEPESKTEYVVDPAYIDLETKFIDENKDTDKYDYSANPGDMIIFDEGGVHRGSKTLKNERVVLRYLYSIKRSHQ